MPTQVPAEAGAAESRGARLSAVALRVPPVPSSAATPRYMAPDMATIMAMTAASRA